MTLEEELLAVLKDHVDHDAFIPIKQIVVWWRQANPSASYISNRFVGRRLRRIGLTDFRQVAGSSEARLSPAIIRELKTRNI